jgi:hypothetical protein
MLGLKVRILCAYSGSTKKHRSEMELGMHLLYAFMGRALLRPRRIHPLDDPLDSPEWAGLWRAFAWRAAFGVWWRSRHAMPRVASRPLPTAPDPRRG